MENERMTTLKMIRTLAFVQGAIYTHKETECFAGDIGIVLDELEAREKETMKAKDLVVYSLDPKKSE